MNFLDRGDTAYGQFVNKYLNDYVYGEVHDLPSTLDELLPMPLPFPRGGRRPRRALFGVAPSEEPRYSPLGGHEMDQPHRCLPDLLG